MQARLNKIPCSGTSNVAVEIFAERLECITSTVCKRYNGAKEGDSRARHRLVIRGYAPEVEVGALTRLLEAPDDGDTAASKKSWTGASDWHLHLSLTFWLLVLFRSHAKDVRELSPDDKEDLHKLQREVDNREDLESKSCCYWKDDLAGIRKGLLRLRGKDHVVDAAASPRGRHAMHSTLEDCQRPNVPPVEKLHGQRSCY
jgi:hypothetical protein